MSGDDATATNKNYNRRVAEELAELDNPMVKKQIQLDRAWQAQRDEAEEYRRLMRELNPTGLKIW